VLTGFATRLRGLCRESDVVARLGGDEFAFLLVDPVTPQQAAAIAERVVLTASAPYLIGEDVISVGASVGITLLTEGEPGLERQVDTVEVLLRQADAAMYRAKNSGRGRAEQYRPGLAGPPSALPTGEAGQLRAALDDGLLELHYQPIYNLANGELVKLEALARWRDAHRGYIPPTEFIAVAEACGLIHDLGRWALRTACRQAAHWGRQSGADERPPKVAVNVSAHQLIGGSLVDDVLSALEGAGLAADRLCLELTETAAVQDLPSTIRQLSELREAGVHLALDDFGTGYSSLTLIRQLPVHVIKVDRSFIDHIDASTADSVLVRLVVEAAHSLGMTVCAEGVERRGQLTELRAMGCDKVQGYLLATPAGPSTVPLGPCELLDGLARSDEAEPMLPAAHELISLADPDGVLRYVSAASVTLLGYQPGELVGTRVHDHLHPDDAVRLAANGFLEHGQATSSSLSYRVRTKDGSYRWLRGRTRLVADGDPGASLLSSARDVTARVETEQELALSGQMLAAAFDLAPVGMALVDLDGTWRDLNQALCRLLGAGRDELLATDLEALTHPDEQRAGLTLAGCLTSTGPSFTRTTRYRHGDGRYLPIEQSVGVIGGAGSEPAHAIVYFQSARPGPSAEALVPK